MFRRLLTLIWTARQRLKLTWRLLQDDRIPTWQKAIPFLPLIYIFSPFNFLTMAIPVFGQLDDLMLLVMAMEFMEQVVDKKIIADYKPE